MSRTTYKATPKAGLYTRLSVDDGYVDRESNSITSQKQMLTQFAEYHGIEIVETYVDDGWSGTNFDRPNFKRMIDDIELDKVNIVIVKDLSRFGREYAQMGMYIEHYFEEKGVRFISVAENIDSKNGIDNLVLPFTNVINSFYARQASSKTKAAHQARAKSGMYLGSHAPFGYAKDPNDRLITGGSSRLGMALALALREEGARPLSVCRTEEGLPPKWYGRFSRCPLTAWAMCG